MLLRDGKFDVYRSSKEANEKKLVRDAFKDGDLYFNYGDVFVCDKDYFLYFSDRIGDTFRFVSSHFFFLSDLKYLTIIPFYITPNILLANVISTIWLVTNALINFPTYQNKARICISQRQHPALPHH